MKILHTADIHLNEYQGERWKVLEELLKIGKEQKIDLFIISGDLFDKGINAEKLKPKIRDLFTNTGFKILLISGNHDKEAYRDDMYLGDDIIFIDDLNNPYKVQDLVIWGLPFETCTKEETLLKLHLLKDKLDIEKKNILLYHGELLDAFFRPEDFGNEGIERYMPAKLSYFKGLKIDYVLAGHFHSQFNLWKLPEGGFFVYPGSPISITKKEIGMRHINLFEVGNPPREEPILTLHYEEVVIYLDPFVDDHPLKVIRGNIQKLHPQARIILTVKGYIDINKVGISESDLAKEIKSLISNKCESMKLEFQNISRILEDDLYKGFEDKIKKSKYKEEKKDEMRNIAIKAMMEVLH